MLKTVLKYGLISGGLLMVSMVATFVLFKDNSWAHSEVVGFAAMFAILSLIFFGIGEQKIQNLGGRISFGQAFFTGLLITLICSIAYTLCWMVISYNDPEMVENMLDGYYNPTDAELPADKAAEIAKMKADYEQPLYRFGMTMMEIFPVGLLLTLIFATIHVFTPQKG